MCGGEGQLGVSPKNQNGKKKGWSYPAIPGNGPWWVNGNTAPHLYNTQGGGAAGGGRLVEEGRGGASEALPSEILFFLIVF